MARAGVFRVDQRNPQLLGRADVGGLAVHTSTEGRSYTANDQLSVRAPWLIDSR